MRLKLIKLAGFKSFVEPTRIELNADMTAVVGPNGCGKSNVIDAVRWVLGESSARHLRGENMTDVIFNGSINRSAHGRASVELVFDNPHNRVPGEFGRFTEISVRREVLRDGSNHYQINGQKCRRKDVTDLFLGTGLGPRSYAIIEQGTVSRLVESRPADLKLFMEEAAGVSRYKERRRETEQRIRHTQENLERLGDILAAELLAGGPGDAPLILDVRWQLGADDGYDDYLQGHLPGAVFVDLERDLSGARIDGGPGGRHPMPTVDDFELDMAECGVDNDRLVVVYDDCGSLAAARCWWKSPPTCSTRTCPPIGTTPRRWPRAPRRTRWMCAVPPLSTSCSDTAITATATAMV